MIKDATVNRGTGGLDVVQAVSVATEIPGSHRLRPTARIDAVTPDPPLVVSVTGRARRTALAIIEANVLYHSLLGVGKEREFLGTLVRNTRIQKRAPIYLWEGLLPPAIVQWPVLGH